MTDKLTRLVTSALDEYASLKTFKIRDQHKFGLSTETKKLIADRDQARKKIAKEQTGVDKKIQHLVYKKLRNIVNSQLKKNNLNFNSEIVKAAKDESEI